jgi:prophage DNA circulation protein
MSALLDLVNPKGKAAIPPDLYVRDLEKVQIGDRQFVGGSFRGVPFFVESHELTGGRRIVVENLPNSDLNSTQDLGRKTRGFSFSAHLLGSDVFAQKQKLIDAMETRGAGELVHPYLGRFQALGAEYTVGEESTVKEFVKISLGFVIDVPKITNKQLKSRPGGLASAKSKNKSALIEGFKKAFKVASMPFAVVDAAFEDVNSAVDAVSAARGSLRAVAAYSEKIKAIKTNLTYLLSQPGLLAESLFDLADFSDDTDPAPDYKREASEALAASAFVAVDPFVSSGSDSDKQIAKNSGAINCLVKQASAGHAVGLLPSIVFESVEEAGRAISAINEAIDAAQVFAIDDRAYYAALDLSTGAGGYVSQISKNLSSVELIELDEVIPVLALIYELYGATEEAGELCRRNRIPDPFFLPVGVNLEVLTRPAVGVLP